MGKKKILFSLGILVAASTFFYAREAGAVDSAAEQPYDRLSTALVTPHIPFAHPYYKGKIKTLVIAPAHTQRETVELAQRLSIDCVPLMTNSFDAFGPPAGPPGMSNEQFGAIIYKKLSKKENYDLIIISKTAWDVFPRFAQEAILGKIKQGTGLVYIFPPNFTELDFVFKKDIGTDNRKDFILAGIPLMSIPLLKDIPVDKLVRLGKTGEGRVAAIDYDEKYPSGWLEQGARLESLTPYQSDDPLFYDYYYALIARACLWASRKEPDIIFKGLPEQKKIISRKELPETRISFGLEGELLRNSHLQYIVRDRKNNIEFSQTEPCNAPETSFSLPPLKAGERIIDIWLKDEDDRIVNWASVPVDVISPIQIEKIKLNKDIYQKGETIEGKVVLSEPMTGNLSLTVEVEDNYGRQVISSSPAVEGEGKETCFAFQLSNPLTRSYTLRAKLIDKSEVLDEAEIPFYLNTTDFSSLISDFSFIIWASAWSNNSRSMNTYLKQLACCGVDILYNTTSVWDVYDKSREIALRIARANLSAAPSATRIDPCNYVSDSPEGPQMSNCILSLHAEEQTRDNRIWHLKDVARAYGPLGPAFYSLGDENALSYPKDADLCFCPKCCESFREYLKRVYSDLSALNKEWGTDYKDWQEVKPITLTDAVKLKRFPQWIDHRLHMEKVFTDYHLSCIKAITEVDPGAKVGIEGPVPYSSFAGFDWYQLLPSFQFFGPYAHIIDLQALASFLPSEAVSSSWFGNYEGQTNEGIMRYAPWKMLFLGMNAVSWWTGRGEFSPDYQPLLPFQQALEEIKEIKSGIARLLLSSEREVDPVAVYFSNVCMHVCRTGLEEEGSASTRKSPWTDSLGDFHYILRDSGYTYRYISPEDIKSGGLKNYKLLILPCSQAISSSDADEIKRFVRDGGVLIADSNPGIMDEHGKMLDKSPLLEVFGEFSRLNIHSYGRGKGVYLSDYIRGYANASRKAEGKDILAETAGIIQKTSGIRPFADVEDESGNRRQDIEISRFKKREADYLCLIRGYIGSPSVVATGTEAQMEGAISGSESRSVKVRLPACSYIYDVRANKFLGYADQFTTSLDPSQARVFALLPSKITGVELKLGKEKYQKGEEVSFQVNVSPAKLAGSGLVMRVEILKPDGKIIPYYTQKLILKSAQAEGIIPLSLNEASGVYRVIVKDIVSGLEAVGEFWVE